MLFKTLLLTLVGWLALVNATEQVSAVPSSARFFAFQATTTKVKIETVVVTTTKQSLCASLVNVTGACQRRKRGMDKPIVLSFDEDDQIDVFNPSPVLPVEPTPVASLDQSIDQKVVDLETSSDLPVEVDIIGLQSDCIGRRFGLISGLAEALNVTLLFTSRLTATATVTKVVTSGTKPFFISGCTPTPFLYKVCN